MTDWISPEVFLFLLKGALLMILGLLLPGVMRRSSATFRHRHEGELVRSASSAAGGLRLAAPLELAGPGLAGRG